MDPIFFTDLQNYFMNHNLPNFVSLTDKEVLWEVYGCLKKLTSSARGVPQTCIQVP